MTELISLDVLQLGIFLICLLLSSFYSGSEAALISISLERAKQLIEQGGKSAQSLNFLVNQPTAVLTTILVGNNLVNTLAASTVTVISQRYFASDAIAISTGVTTFLILIFGEITPKTFARTHAEKLCFLAIKFLRFNYIILYPIIVPITFFIKVVLGKNADLKERLVSKNDIQYMVNQAEKEKTIDSQQIDLMSSVLEFPTIKVKDIMVPRKEIKTISINNSFQEVVAQIREEAHSRYPVVGNSIDDIKGFLHVKTLTFVKETEEEKFNVSKFLRPPFFVYEHMRIHAVFEHMRKKKIHLALVKDENGLIVGIITLEDIIEEILGEIQDEYDDEQESENYEDGISITGINADGEVGLTIDGDWSLRDMSNEYDIKIPLNDNYSTLAGFLLEKLGNNFPEEGQVIFGAGYSFKILKVENHEILKVNIQQVDGDHISI